MTMTIYGACLETMLSGALELGPGRRSRSGSRSPVKAIEVSEPSHYFAPFRSAEKSPGFGV